MPDKTKKPPHEGGFRQIWGMQTIKCIYYNLFLADI